MRRLSLIVAITAIIQPAPQSVTQWGTLSLSLRQVAVPCVATAPLPLLELSSGDPMPIARLDTSRLAPMPVAKLVPCYLADLPRATVRQRSSR